jgi:hypothetical protein
MGDLAWFGGSSASAVQIVDGLDGLLAGGWHNRTAHQSGECKIVIEDCNQDPFSMLLPFAKIQ